MNADEFWDYCHQPENESRLLDLSRGRIVEWQRPTRRRGFVAARAGYELGRYERTIGMGCVTASCGVILGPNRDTVRGVDAAYFIDGETGQDGWATVPPQLAVLVLNPEDEPAEWVGWLEDFLEHGTRQVWMIRPEERSVGVFLPDLTTRTVREGELLVGGDDLPAFTCRVADFFRLPGQSSPS
jgi:Uma2 family endonuclease